MPRAAEKHSEAESRVARFFGLRRRAIALLALLLLVAAPSPAQDQPPGDPRLANPEAPLASPREIPWKEGAELRIRVPVATEKHEVMTTVAFPETGIQAAVTGWGTNSITAIQKGGFLFLKLLKASEGQLNVIGDSGVHYL